MECNSRTSILPTTMRAEKTKVTLVVLQHGLWGKPVHMQYIEDSLIEAYGDKNVAIVGAFVVEIV